MLSELRKRKLQRFFVLVDTDGDGVFTAADTDLLGKRLMALRNLQPGSDGYDNFMAVFTYYWAELRKACDSDEDGRVTLKEWIDYHETMLQDEERFDATAKNSAAMMFAMMDADGDGIISTDEYRQWMGAWNMADGDRSDEVLARLDPDGTGSFTQEQVLELTRQFFYSDDVDSPGNWAMGPY